MSFQGDKNKKLVQTLLPTARIKKIKSSGMYCVRVGKKNELSLAWSSLSRNDAWRTAAVKLGLLEQ
jgi:hypothetical protein